MQVASRKTKRVLYLPHTCNGALVTPAEFDRAEFEDGWRYELVNGVLIVSPIPSDREVDLNEELGRLLRNYKVDHPEGKVLTKTLFERYVKIGGNRRRPDRVVWTGLGRAPKEGETPSIIVEFVSARKRDHVRDYETKRDEYMAIPVKEYWIINRFERNMVVFTKTGGKIRRRTFGEKRIYKTRLLPGFELRLADLFALVEDWSAREEDID